MWKKSLFTEGQLTAAVSESTSFAETARKLGVVGDSAYVNVSRRIKRLKISTSHFFKGKANGIKPGETFGKLTVVHRLKTHGGRAKYLCLCSCGNETSVDGSSLAVPDGGTKSCGCAWDPDLLGNRNRKPFGESSFNSLYNKYKHGAKRRSLEFSLTKDQFKHITGSPCEYCGDPAKHSAIFHESSNGHYLYNGVDRSDNSRGYTLDNAVPCCVVCNRAKNTMPKEDFLAWIDRLQSRPRFVSI